MAELQANFNGKKKPTSKPKAMVTPKPKPTVSATPKPTLKPTPKPKPKSTSSKIGGFSGRGIMKTGRDY